MPDDTPDDTLAALGLLREHDLPVHTGRTLAYVFDTGMAEVDRIAAAAVGAFAATNGLDPTAFPSLRRMESDLVARAAELLDAPADAAGALTSGGTESCLLAVLAARDGAPHVSRPVLVVADTVHPAFHKAAHYFGLETRIVPTAADCRADADAMVAALDDDVVLVVVSAPSYAHGVIDPVPEVAAAAAARGIRCHVDACIGGWVLPYAARLGRPVPPWTFAVDGVTSISVDLHKYGYAPKGTSVLLHRDADLRRGHLFAWAGWPGYPLINSTTQSTRSGGPIAGAWAVARELGDEGYLRLAGDALAATDAIVAAIAEHPQLRLAATPDSTLVAAYADDSCDVFTIADEMAERGWHLQVQLSHGPRPASLHVSVSAATLGAAEEFAAALRESVAAAVAAGPVDVDPGLAEVIATLDPAGLTTSELAELLAVAGIGGGADGGDDFALPERRAEVNALLDLASPALREAVLLTFFDLLSQ